MTAEYVDVIVVGAEISGIGAAYHLQTMCPNRTYTILEGREDIGGTWDLFRYPGVRSDSDMHTLGYRFKPWTASKAIADGPSIMAYLRETVAEPDGALTGADGGRLRRDTHTTSRLTAAKATPMRTRKKATPP